MRIQNIISKAFKEHYASLILYALKWVKDEDIAKDMVQTVFINLLERTDDGIIKDYRAYLFQSVRNQCINNLKKNSPETGRLEENQTKEFGYFNDPVEEAEFESFVFSLIDKLPPATKNIFKLNRFEGLSNQEIADKLNISKRTVELQISNALKFLREKLFSQDNQNPTYSQFLFLLF